MRGERFNRNFRGDFLHAEGVLNKLSEEIVEAIFKSKNWDKYRARKDLMNMGHMRGKGTSFNGAS